MHDHLRDARLVELLDLAFQQLPKPVASPQLCYQRLIRGGTERIPLADAAGPRRRGDGHGDAARYPPGSHAG
ncbi:hypothetical protein LV779_34130 [Streptomyces thinghirensis]|nr:hypothetical protein [Streptomyces thinghirensis]